MPQPSEQIIVALVEDDPRIRQLIMDEIADEGHDCRGYGSAEAFLNEVSDLAPNLVLLDLMLPGMDGLDCLRALNQTPGPVPCHVVIVTAVKDSTKREQALALGAEDYILKPDLFDRLPQLLASLIRASAEA
ncbi:MAG: response regulator [Cyanobacteriota bacterium]|nr:response regulator [Cyanobacteriota bacterium]